MLRPPHSVDMCVLPLLTVLPWPAVVVGGTSLVLTTSSKFVMALWPWMWSAACLIPWPRPPRLVVQSVHDHARPREVAAEVFFLHPSWSAARFLRPIIPVIWASLRKVAPMTMVMKMTGMSE